jgi:hypothetical protein
VNDDISTQAPRVRSIGRVISVSIAVAIAFVLVSADVATAGFPRSGSGVRNWAPEHIGRDHSHTRKQAIATARAFDTIVAVRGAYRGLIDDMRSVNPDLVVLVYLNGAFAQDNQGSAFPSEWYAKDSQGRKIRSRGYGNYLMTPSRSGWIDHVRDLCARFRSQGHFNGCFIDMLGTALLEPGYLSAKPINPATGDVWTPNQWLRATSDLARAAKRRISPRLVAANGLRNGNQYYSSGASSEQLVWPIDGGGAESWIRVAHQGVRNWPTVLEWKRNVNMLKDASAQGKSVLVLTKLWVSATKAQRLRWHRFALGSFLLGDGGRSYFYFSGSRTASPTRGHRWWRVRLGDALGAYQKVNGIYQRTFRRGKVLVNPTGNTVRVALGGLYVSLTGVRQRITRVGPHSAQILKEI